MPSHRSGKLSFAAASAASWVATRTRVDASGRLLGEFVQAVILLDDGDAGEDGDDAEKGGEEGPTDGCPAGADRVSLNNGGLGGS